MIGIVWGIATGQTVAVNDALIEGGKAAVQLCIGMAGVVSAWCGLMEIARKSGIEAALSKALRPVVKFLFPKIPDEHPAMNAICLNLTANILGLGWAATPAGLVAMKELKTLKKEFMKEAMKEAVNKFKSERTESALMDTASDEMCTFLVINISSLQLMPVNMIAYRSSCGSAAPAAIVGPGILATLASTVAAVLFCLIKTRKKM